MAEQKTITVRNAIGLGVGSMVGAGIFALLGEAAAMAGSAVWLMFLAAGVIALLTGYSFVQLGIRYPTRGGIVEYLVRAYGSGTFSGSCSILFYIAQLIGVAMISLAFGKYAAQLIGLSDNLAVWERVLASGLVVALAALNLAGSKLIGKIQKIIVIANLAILGSFAVALSSFGDVSHLSVNTWPDSSPILGSLALTFFAFTGFAVISNAADRMKDPAKDLPRAMFSTIGIVIVLYIALAVGVIGAVDTQTLTSSGPMLLVEAARSAFGPFALKVLLISAVISTITCINGGLFGITNITYTLAVKGQLPSRFQEGLRSSTHGLTISVVIALIMLNFLSLTTVASLGSATSLLVYSLVNLGALRLIKGTLLSRTLILLSVVACVFAVCIWVIYTVQSSPSSLGIFAFFLVAAFVAETLLQRYQGRRVKPDADVPS
jgi:amino acid transporter